jgi:hypothetical protein
MLIGADLSTKGKMERLANMMPHFEPAHGLESRMPDRL